jgi:hypothetical protein
MHQDSAALSPTERPSLPTEFCAPTPREDQGQFSSSMPNDEERSILPTEPTDSCLAGLYVQRRCLRHIDANSIMAAKAATAEATRIAV